MIEAIRALPELIKDWKVSRNQVYQHVGCIAGILTIAAYFREQRPSEVLADLFIAAGAHRIGAWLESELPPFLAQPDAQANHTLVQLAGVTVLLMLMMPFHNARRNESHVDIQAMGLVEARAASTTWVLLVIAAQFGSIQWSISWLIDTGRAIGVTMVVGSFVLLAVYLVAQRLWMHDLLEAVGDGLAGVISHGTAVIAMTFFALVFVVIGPLFFLGRWLLSTQSDAHYESEQQIAKRRAERKIPTGATLSTLGEMDIRRACQKRTSPVSTSRAERTQSP